MSRIPITILDYGVGNLNNVCRVFDYCKADVHIAKNPRELNNAKRIVIPGVGSFKNCMDQIINLGFKEAILDAYEKKIPILGICVGMQILFEYSEEFGHHSGLGIFKGGVKSLSKKLNNQKNKVRVPHIGWNSLINPMNNRTWDNTILDHLSLDMNWFYFVHSYAAEPLDDEITLADCIYGHNRICSIVERDNIYGTQFHLELSGAAGIALVKNFLKM
jgi:glutamine amidotransferase